ncbi:MAG: hypothetical protein V9G13_07780 [Marmoricola sp.]
MIEIRGLGHPECRRALRRGRGAAQQARWISSCDLVRGREDRGSGARRHRHGRHATGHGHRRSPAWTLPVAPGRDVAGLIELAAMNYKLRAFGYNSAVEFDQRLLKKMTDDQLG